MYQSVEDEYQTRVLYNAMLERKIQIKLMSEFQKELDVQKVRAVDKFYSLLIYMHYTVFHATRKCVAIFRCYYETKKERKIIRISTVLIFFIGKSILL